MGNNWKSFVEKNANVYITETTIDDENKMSQTIVAAATFYYNANYVAIIALAVLPTNESAQVRQVWQNGGLGTFLLRFIPTYLQFHPSRPQTSFIVQGGNATTNQQYYNFYIRNGFVAVPGQTSRTRHSADALPWEDNAKQEFKQSMKTYGYPKSDDIPLLTIEPDTLETVMEDCCVSVSKRKLPPKAARKVRTEREAKR